MSTESSVGTSIDATCDKFLDSLVALIPNAFVGLQCKFLKTVYTVVAVKDEYATMQLHNGKVQRMKARQLFSGFCKFLDHEPTSDHDMSCDRALWMFIRACASVSTTCETVQASWCGQ